jgi:CheY-like chemotaxis protein
MALKILYIEDNALNMSLIRKMLKPMNYDIIGAFDAASGLRIAEQEKPDLILLDMLLPDMPGWEVITHLKANLSSAMIPVIVLTADTSSAVYQQCQAAGSDGYLIKPVSRATLVRTIEQNLAVAKVS